MGQLLIRGGDEEKCVQSIKGTFSTNEPIQKLPKVTIKDKTFYLTISSPAKYTFIVYLSDTRNGRLLEEWLLNMVDSPNLVK